MLKQTNVWCFSNQLRYIQLAGSLSDEFTVYFPEVLQLSAELKLVAKNLIL